MALIVALSSIAVLLSVAILAVPICRLRLANTVIYASCLTISFANLTTVGLYLFGQHPPLWCGCRSGCLGLVQISASTRSQHYFWP